MSTIVANRVTSSTSSSQIKQEHVKDENDTNNNDYHNENNNNNNNNNNNSSSSDNKYDSFFDEWKVGNWCWERDYKKYPVVAVSLPANKNNDNDNGGINSRSSERTIKEESCNDVQKCFDDDKNANRHDNSDNEESNESVTPDVTPTATTATTKKDERTKKSSSNSIRIPRKKIGAEEKKEEDNSRSSSSSSINSMNGRTRADLKNTTKGGDDDDDDDDDDNDDNDNDNDNGFYDDWVEGNWCLLDDSDNNNSNNNNNNNDGDVGDDVGDDDDDDDDDDDGSSHKMQHEITTTPNLRKKSKKNNNESARRKLKRCRYDDDDDDDSHNEDDEDDEDEEEESDDEDNNDDNKKEEEFISKDSKSVHNHQEDKQPANKRSQRQTHYDNYRDQIWMGMFQELVEHKKQHKTTLVKNKNDPKLGQWIHTQRKNYKNKNLRPYRNDILNSIGFEWDGNKRQTVTDQMIWMNMFQKLVEYKKEHKNTIVPTNYKNDPKLGFWVMTQRVFYKKDELLPNRYALLISIGFKWYGSKENNQQLWMGMFQKLVAYNEQHENTMVPGHNCKLGRWVGKQRHVYNRGELLPARIALLKSIGFIWDGLVSK